MVYINDDLRKRLIEASLAPMKDITPKDTKPVGERGPLTADEKAKMKVGSGSTNPTSPKESKQQKIKEVLQKRKKLKEGDIDKIMTGDKPKSERGIAKPTPKDKVNIPPPRPQDNGQGTTTTTQSLKTHPDPGKYNN